MNTFEPGTSGVAADSPMHWHFRALPDEVQRGTIRRLAISGLHEREIAARTGLSIDSVRRAVAEDDCLKMLRTLTTGGVFGSRLAHRGSMAN
ncbi:hypothetical protein ACFPN2_01670 [Steroidobacter flavus]|uniref:Uncharacterized protein n=1 Tax=Steroidobacter flavus TaxID=1842136 RepID=A0ABV8SK86_9GAMM